MSNSPLGLYILDGHEAVPVDDLHAWAVWFETAERHVALTEVAPGITVSTVFLGVDHSMGRRAPILFETMVFNDYGDDGTQARYSTWEEAAFGHEMIVSEKRAYLAGDPLPARDDR